ncbi:MAG: serine/threonine-protein kinase [Pseudomonadota bacterium]
MNDPKTIGRYEIICQIGVGGFATVYLGRDPYINRSVALKVSAAGSSAAKNPALARLFQEAAAAGALIHPNIVTIFDAGIEDPICYIAMEYIEGTTLYKNCLPAELLPVADAIDVMIKVCHGLDFAHQRGIIHRDVKPGNILLGANGEIKIADFGLACFALLAKNDKKVVGTPSYMPPEQIEGKGSTPQSDIFSAGIILYRLLSGEKPFEATDALEMRRKILREPHIPLAERNPDLPPELFAITDRAMAKDPNDRYRTAFDFARDLEGVLHGSKKALGGKMAERIRHLRTLRFFEEFSEAETADMLAIGAWLTHKDGEPIIREREQEQGFYVIVSGEAAVVAGERTAGTLGRGDCFGEVSFLLGRRRTATVRAVGECNLLRLNPQKIDILPHETQIKLYRLFARTVAGRLLKAEGAL